jgi:hypothetical protein
MQSLCIADIVELRCLKSHLKSGDVDPGSYLCALAKMSVPSTNNQGFPAFKVKLMSSVVSVFTHFMGLACQPSVSQAGIRATFLKDVAINFVLPVTIRAVDILSKLIQLLTWFATIVSKAFRKVKANRLATESGSALKRRSLCHGRSVRVVY